MNDSSLAVAHAEGALKRKRDHHTPAAETTASATAVAEERHVAPQQYQEQPAPCKGVPSSSKRLRVSDCPWSDAIQAPTVWALVADHMLGEARALDRSSFDDAATKGHLRVARTLLRVGSTCRALYNYIGWLGVRLDALVAIEDDGEEKHLLWCVVARTHASPHKTTFDTDFAVYQRLLRVERLVMRSGHLCARHSSQPFKHTSVAAASIDSSAFSNDGSEPVRTMKIAAETGLGENDINTDGAGDNCMVEPKDREDESDEEEECDTDDTGEEDGAHGGDNNNRSFESTIEVPAYQDLWDLIEWPRVKDMHGNDNGDGGVSDDEEFEEEEEDYDDTHEEEEGTLSETDCRGRDWTLTVYSHYHHGLVLVNVHIVS